MRSPSTSSGYPRTLEMHDDDPAEILVVFVGETECRYLNWLKEGFRHCFVALQRENRWIICDSLKNQIEFLIADLPSHFDLGSFYRSQGHTVVAGFDVGLKPDRFMIPELLTCVTITKRIIGIRSFWTLTPWQLFCLLDAMHDRWRLVE